MDGKQAKLYFTVIFYLDPLDEFVPVYTQYRVKINLIPRYLFNIQIITWMTFNIFYSEYIRTVPPMAIKRIL